MKRIIIFGSGQMGQMLKKHLGGDYEVLCFVDNAKEKQGTYLEGVKVLSPKEALKLNPEAILLGVLDNDRGSAMRTQLKELGFHGEIITGEMLRVFDARVATMNLLANEIGERELAGACGELGVYKGEFARCINRAFPDRKLYLFDTFEGFVEGDVNTETAQGFSRAKVGDFSDTDEVTVRESMPFKENVITQKGIFPESLSEASESLSDERFVFVSLDADLYEPTKAGLEFFWERLVPYGVIMLHDYNSGQFRGVKKAFVEFAEGHEDFLTFPVCDLHGSLVIKKLAGK